MKKEASREVPVSHPIVQKKIDKSLKLSVKEGSYAAATTGLDISYFSPYALAMNATASQVGILSAVTGLVPGLVQMFCPGWVSKFPRKKVVLTIVMLKILILIPIILSGLLFLLGYNYMVWVLIVLVGIFYGLVAIGQPAWFSWMGSLVPEQKRGSYFSMRNRVTGFFGVLSMVAGAVILDASKEIGITQGKVLAFTLLGFGVIFTLAIIFRFLSWSLLAVQYEPRLVVRKKDNLSFWQFIKKAPYNPFGRFTIFRGFFSVAIGIATPFWAVYMIRDLGFSYVWFMAITVSVILFELMFLPIMGKFSDKFGNSQLIKICCWVSVVLPLLWLVSPLIENDLTLKLYLLIVPSFVGGFAWSGYNLATSNYVYDAVGSHKRSFGVSYVNILVDGGIFVGAIIGSIIVSLDLNGVNPLLLIFFISAVLRLIVAFFGLKHLTMVRKARKFNNPGFFIKEFGPMQGMVKELQDSSERIRKIRHFI
jgi:MFS family permease